jgi:hypothetical protein
MGSLIDQWEDDHLAIDRMLPHHSKTPEEECPVRGVERKRDMDNRELSSIIRRVKDIRARTLWLIPIGLIHLK